MKKFFTSLPFRLIVALAIGIVLGQIFGVGPMKVVVSIQYILGQLITFCVPLIVIGFIAPSITRMGNNASKMLGVAVIIAYISSICAAFMSTGSILTRRVLPRGTGFISWCTMNPALMGTLPLSGKNRSRGELFPEMISQR